MPYKAVSNPKKNRIILIIIIIIIIIMAKLFQNIH